MAKKTDDSGPTPSRFPNLSAPTPSAPAPAPVPPILDPSVLIAAKALTAAPGDEETLSDARKLDAALNVTVQPMATKLIGEARMGLVDLTIEEQLALATKLHENIGKASGYLPDFTSMSENVKAAYLKSVRDIWIEAQRKARSE